MKLFIILPVSFWLFACGVATVSNITGICRNGVMIQPENLCNGFDDCVDGFASDECACADTRYACANDKCIRSINLCDGIDDCQDGFESDEANCDANGSTLIGANCKRRDSVKCADDVTCVSLHQMCDGVYDCPDQSDEIFGGPGLKCVIKTSRDVTCTIPQPNVYDVTGQCSQNEDVCFDERGERTERCFQCLDGNHIITSFQVCNGILDCSDFSDECLCEAVKTKSICQDLYVAAIQSSVTCIYGMVDVRDSDDGNPDYSNYETAQNGSRWIESIFACGDGTCAPSSVLCNGFQECENDEDEKYCFSPSSLELIDSLNVNSRVESSSVASFANRSRTANGSVICNNSDRKSFSAVKCDGSPGCDVIGEDECIPECGELPPFCHANLTCLWAPYICDGIWHSDNECGERIMEEEMGCPRRFYCANGPAISIGAEQVCDGTINCDDESDESMERNCNDGRFYCEVRSNKSGDRAFVPQNLVFNGRIDCSDGSDECPSSLDGDAFSSRQEMINNVVLKAILWVIAPVALIGNLVVIIQTINIKRKRSKPQNQVSEIHHFMVLNLATADGLMGLYLVIICIVSTQSTGQYCHMDKIWRSSLLCKVLGALLVVSTEASVMILLTMGGFRFYTIFRPFGTQFSSKITIWNKVFILTSWLVAIVLAVLPVVLSDFDSNFWVTGPLFIDDTVPKSVYEELSGKLDKMKKRNNLTEVTRNITTANVTVAYKSSVTPDVKFRGTFGYYSQNSICLPTLFTRPPVAGWQYSVAIVTFNFVTFAFMVIFYALIVRLSSDERDKQLSASLPRGGKLNHRKCKLQSRVTRLLITDFVCWIPICIMSYVYLGGVNINNVVYAVCGVVLLPINSALNPLLYAGILDSMLNTLKQKFTKPKRQPTTNESRTQIKSTRNSFLKRIIDRKSRSENYVSSENQVSVCSTCTTSVEFPAVRATST